MKTALGLALVALAAAGCGTSEAQVAPAQHAVAEQLNFNATTVDGQAFSGASLAGKAAVLWFWTPWCETCQEETTGVAKTAQDHHDKVTFIGVGAEDKVPAMKDFVTRYGLGSFTNLADTDAAVWRRFGITYQPGYAFISPQGTVEVVKSGMDDTELAAKVDQLARS